MTLIAECRKIRGHHVNDLNIQFSKCSFKESVVKNNFDLEWFASSVKCTNLGHLILT